MSKYFKKTLIIFLSSILLLLIVTISILWGFSNDLPDYKFLKNYKAPVSSKVYSGDGDLIQDFSSEKRIYTLMLRIQMKHALFLKKTEILKTMNMKV